MVVSLDKVIEWNKAIKSRVERMEAVINGIVNSGQVIGSNVIIEIVVGM